MLLYLVYRINRDSSEVLIIETIDELQAELTAYTLWKQTGYNYRVDSELLAV